MKNTSVKIATIAPITSPTVPIYSEASVVGWLVATLEVEFDVGVVVGPSQFSWPRPDPSHAYGGQALRMRICISKTEIRKQSSQELKPMFSTTPARAFHVGESHLLQPLWQHLYMHPQHHNKNIFTSNNIIIHILTQSTKFIKVSLYKPTDTIIGITCIKLLAASSNSLSLPHHLTNWHIQAVFSYFHSFRGINHLHRFSQCSPRGWRVYLLQPLGQHFL